MKEKILDIAWKSINEYILNKKIWDPDLNDKKYNGMKEKRGVFTTIYSFKSGSKELRGCIGFPYPIYAMAHSISKSARKAATEDPRFTPINENEIKNGYLKLSIEILGPMEKIDYKKTDVKNTIKDIADRIEIGVHGLYVKNKGISGILLPKVPVEWKWNKEEYIHHVFQKAWLPIEQITDENTEIYAFTSEIYSEL